MNAQPVTLQQVLDAREKRALRQRALLETHSGPLISFTMNIAGPVKDTDLIRRGFDEGLRLIRLQLRMTGTNVRHFEETRAITGCEALLAVEGEPLQIKRLMAALEDEGDLGRLFDIDVLRPDGGKIDRGEIGRPPRRCLLCGQSAAVCGPRRLHTVEQLQARTTLILTEYFAGRFVDAVTALAQRSLLYEVCVTPKPGLVDRANNGAHDDMDMFTFCDSASVLGPYFRACARTGIDTAPLPPESTFDRLVLPGRLAEAAMERATGGVNTHRGAIYSMGVLCAALGRQYGAGAPVDADAALRLCGDITRPAADRAFAAMSRTPPRTAGHRLYRELGIRGIRGEAADGFPSVRKIALPVLEAELNRGADRDLAGARALLALIAAVTDTNMIARSDPDTAAQARGRAARLASSGEPAGPGQIAALDAAFTARRLSPGGCADLLSIAWMAHFIRAGQL